jgi:enoyl-CoA hydratase
MTTPVLQVGVGGPGVTILTLARPERHNALSIELRAALTDALAAIARDADARCTIVTGAGSSFCSGMDHTEFGGDAAHRRRLLEVNEDFFTALLDHPLPLVAAVNGPALGGGFALAALCDLRVAAPTAEFGFPEARRGIPPSLGSALRVLPPAVAHDLALTGRSLNAAQAAALGLAGAVVEARDLLDVARERAAEIAAIPASATRTSVAWIRQGAWREQLDREAALLRATLLRD